MLKHLAFCTALFTVLPAGPGFAEIIPCDPMNVGNMWKYSERSATGSSEVTRLVTSNEAGVITVSETAIHTFSEVEMKQEQVLTLHEEDGTVVLKEISIQSGLVKIEPNMPICGPMENEGISLGSETVEVPAGRFDAQVYEIVVEGASLDGGGQAPTRHWSTMYYVPGIGTVKWLMVNEVPMPKMPQPTAQDPAVAALLQEGIAAMQKGEDPAKFFEELARLEQPAAGDGTAPAIEMRKNTITRELIEFAIE